LATREEIQTSIANDFGLKEYDKSEFEKKTLCEYRPVGYDNDLTKTKNVWVSVQEEGVVVHIGPCVDDRYPGVTNTDLSLNLGTGSSDIKLSSYVVIAKDLTECQWNPSFTLDKAKHSPSNHQTK